jgi:hypothetical protein
LLKYSFFFNKNNSAHNSWAGKEKISVGLIEEYENKLLKLTSQEEKTSCGQSNGSDDSVILLDVLECSDVEFKKNKNISTQTKQKPEKKIIKEEDQFIQQVKDKPETIERLNDSIDQEQYIMDSNLKSSPSSPLHSIWFSSLNKSLSMLDSVNEVLVRTGKLHVKRKLGG